MTETGSDNSNQRISDPLHCRDSHGDNRKDDQAPNKQTNPGRDNEGQSGFICSGFCTAVAKWSSVTCSKGFAETASAFPIQSHVT